MKIRILIWLIVLVLAVPSASQASGLLRYLFDGIANQLGLDRGPIPKTLPRQPPLDPGLNGKPLLNGPPPPTNIYIQAEGF